MQRHSLFFTQTGHDARGVFKGTRIFIIILSVLCVQVPSIIMIGY